MKALIVYESVFGNTEKIAGAVAGGIEESADVTVVEAGAAPTNGLENLDLLVVGGPVHAFGMSRAISRRDAGKNSGKGSISGDRGLREWFADVKKIGKISASAFDTRVDKILGILPLGSARRPIANRLKKRGCRLIDNGEGFFVTGTEGPLEEGELDRAREWGRSLAKKVVGKSRAEAA